MIVRLRKENFANGIYNGIDRGQFFEIFFSENEECLQKVVANQVDTIDFKYVEQLDLPVHMEAFKLLPNKTKHEQHKDLAKLFVSHFAEKSLTHDRDEGIDYTNRHEFLRKYAFLVLSAPEEDVQHYLKPFLENLGAFDVIADLLQEFVSVEDTLGTYDNFWLVWGLLKEHIFKLCERGEGYYNVGKIVRSYLFAETTWQKSAKDWRTFKERDKRFFREISSALGYCESTLLSIAKLLNGIGSTYQDEGVVWMSTIVGENPSLVRRKLETNTIYHLEIFIKQYVFKNREHIRRTRALKSRILVILDFLIEKGSVTGYMLRENIV